MTPESAAFKMKVKQITYKPGVTIEVLDSWSTSPDESLMINFLAIVPDVNAPQKDFVLRYSECISGHVVRYLLEDESAFLRFFREVFRKLEMHEVDEWFGYNGKRLFDPHAGQDVALASQKPLA